MEVTKGSLRGVGGGTWKPSGMPFSGLWSLEDPLEPASDLRNGMDTVTVVPWPGSVLITILPSLRRTNRAATARPSPIDDLSASRHGSTSTSWSSSRIFSKSWKIPSSSGLGR